MDKDIFKVGDRVICIREHDGNYDIVEETGVVIARSEDILSIEFDSDIGGHSGLDNSGTYGHCWNFRRDSCAEYLELLSAEVISENELCELYDW